MGYTLRRYSDSDFIRVRNFLSESYTPGTFNWRIERWNFAFSLSSAMHDGLEHLRKSIGIWEDSDKRIVAVANSEGEMQGEAFFQFRPGYRTRELMEDMFSFAEENAAVEKYLMVFIPCNDRMWGSLALERGYSRHEGLFRQTVIRGNVSFRKPLPPGFSFVSGYELGARAKAEAHAAAFGYADEPEYVERAEKGFTELSKMPDYRSDLDVFLVEDDKGPVSFASMWYDGRNRISVVEPMGTLPGYRRRGLGTAALHEGIRRCMELGSGLTYGGDLQFYHDIGFETELEYSAWEKHMDRKEQRK